MSEEATPLKTTKPRSSRSRSKKPQGNSVPAEKLQPGLDALLRIGTTVVAILATRGIQDERKREQLRDVLPLTKEESPMISTPAANLLEKSWLNRVLGSAIAGSEDYAALLGGVYAYIDRVQTQLQEIAEYERTSTPGGVSSESFVPAA